MQLESCVITTAGYSGRGQRTVNTDSVQFKQGHVSVAQQHNSMHS
jgi:hypothetical protein